MAYNIDENCKVTHKKGNKIAQGFVKKIGDLQNINDAEYDQAIKIIKETSKGRRDSLRRMKNFHRDIFPPVLWHIKKVRSVAVAMEVRNANG